MSLTETPTSSERESERWPIFVISLADAHERRHRIMAQCMELGLGIEIIDAIDGRAGLLPEFEAEIDREAARLRHGRPLADAEFACALSHRLIYQRILAENLPGAVVLEDDASLSTLFADFVRAQGYHEADFIQMDYGSARVFWRQRRSWSKKIELVPLAENAHLTSGYSISAKGARYMLSRTAPLAGIADWPCDVVPLRPLVTLPRIVAQPPKAQSYIRGARQPHLINARRQLMQERRAAGPRWKRFLRKEYWQRWWLKRRTVRIAEPEGLYPDLCSGTR